MKKYSYLDEKFIKTIYEFDLEQCYNNLKERFKIGHPMVRPEEEGRIDADFLLRKEIDDKLVWNQFLMKKRLYEWIQSDLGATFISDKAYSLIANAISGIEERHKSSVIWHLLHKKLHREHVVPYNVIKNEILKQREHLTIEYFRKLCEGLLHLAIITEDERERLDKSEMLEKGEQSLRKNMPDGWKIGDSITARLETAGIAFGEMTDEMRKGDFPLNFVPSSVYIK